MIPISYLGILMNRKLLGVVICFMILASITMGCFEEDKSDKPNKAPVADAGSDIEVLSMTEIQFSSSNSTDPDGKLTAYEWDFGDSSMPGKELSTDSNPKYTYNSPGVYKVKLTVTDDDDASTTVTINVTVKNRKPEVEVGKDIIANVFEVIFFNGTGYDFDGFITSYEWDFDGDGEFDWYSANTGMTTHFYKTPGEYEARLKVTDDIDAWTVATQNITILEEIKHPPIADAGSGQTAPVGQILLKGTGFDSDGIIILYEWDFDGDDVFDWSSENTGIVTHDYLLEDTYNAKLRVTDDSELTDSDTVTILIDNTYVTQNVGAQVFINWSSTYDYLIILNNTVNITEIKVIISDIITDEEEVFSGPSMNEINSTSYGLTSTLTPMQKHSIQVQVFYYGQLIGARSLDIINESYEYLAPELDFIAIYDLDQTIEEHDVNEADILRVTSIGEFELEHRGDLYYTTLHGTGEYYIFETFEDGESETRINATDLWLNVTMEGSEIVSKSISLTGHGTMNAVYYDGLNMDLDILEVRLVNENSNIIENYMYGEGTFSSSIEDPNTSVTIEMSGDVYFTSELLGSGYHKNWVGEEYQCSIQRVNVTLDGQSGTVGSFIKTPFTSTTINTTWSVDYEKYTNNTIYYEYTYNTTVANLDYYDEGSGYPENSPAPSKPEVHIEDALSFETPRPNLLLGQDSIILESKHGIKLRLHVTGELKATISGKKYECVTIRGDIIEGGEGHLNAQVISAGTFAGVTVYEVEELYWKGEWVKGETSLKYIG